MAQLSFEKFADVMGVDLPRSFEVRPRMACFEQDAPAYRRALALFLAWCGGNHPGDFASVFVGGPKAERDVLDTLDMVGGPSWSATFRSEAAQRGDEWGNRRYSLRGRPAKTDPTWTVTRTSAPSLLGMRVRIAVLDLTEMPDGPGFLEAAASLSDHVSMRVVDGTPFKRRGFFVLDQIPHRPLLPGEFG